MTTGLFGSKPPKIKPQVVPETDPSKNQEARDAAEAERKRARLATGYAATLLTGGQGVTEPATVRRNTLLGQA